MDVDPVDTTNQLEQTSSSSSRRPHHHRHNRSYRRERRNNRRHLSEGGGIGTSQEDHSSRIQEEATAAALSAEEAAASRHRRHRHHRHHHHGPGKILVKYLRTVARNSLHNLYDDLTTARPPEMSVHYQNIHEYLQQQQAQAAAHHGAQAPASPNVLHINAPGQINEMHEFISANEAAAAAAAGAGGIPMVPPPPPLPTPVYNPYAPPPTRSGLFPLTDFLQDPLNAGLNTLTKVASLARSPTTIINTAASSASAAYNMIHQNTNHIFTRPPGHVERIYPNLHPHNGVLDPFNLMDGEDAIPLPPPVLPLINCTVPQNRLEPLTAADLAGKTWTREELCVRVFKGGIAEDNQLRTRLWPLILGLADDDLQGADTTVDGYEFNWDKLQALYKHYRGQWEAILPEQEKRFSLFRERKSLIERDVIRCDRTHPYYKGETESLESMRALLLTYMMYDFDTGYVQGMSDLASPVLYVAEGDIGKAFWFFTQVMEFTHNNFEMSQSTIKLQLDMLWKLIELTDPIFAQYLANNESINCYFAFRWIVCQFKREFMKTNNDDYADILQLWESIWTCSAMRRHLTKLREESKAKAAKEQSEASQEEDVAARTASPQSSTSTSISVPSIPSPECFNSISLKELTALEEERESAELVSQMQCSLKLDDDTSPGSGPQANQPETTTTVPCEEERQQQPEEPDEAKSEAGSSRPSITAQSVNLNVYVPEVKRLSDTELYVLCICLCIIRRERDLIMANRYDATEILKHFNTLQLNTNLRDILLHASNIWSWLVFDEKEELLYARPPPPSSSSGSVSSLLNQAGGGGTTPGCSTNGSTVAQQGSAAGSSVTTRNEADDFDLLPDAKIPGISGEDYFLMNS